MRLFRCLDCKREAAVLTEVSGDGDSGLPHAAVCNLCMGSGRWEIWKTEYWPNWPTRPNAGFVPFDSQSRMYH
jgi:hypothetical protein